MEETPREKTVLKPLPSDDDLIAAFAFQNAGGPPYNMPPNLHMPENEGFCQADERESLTTDVHSERFRGGICTLTSPPPGSGNDPVVHHVEEKITISTTDILTRGRKRRMVPEICPEGLKSLIARHKDFILGEIETDDGIERNAGGESPRPKSAKWRFFERKRTDAPPESEVRVVHKDVPSFGPDDESMMKHLPNAASSSTRAFHSRQPDDELSKEIFSERWKGDIHQMVPESPRDGLRLDLETPPKASLSGGIPSNELLISDEEERRISAENNRNQYRRDNETFSYKKGLLRRFLEQDETHSSYASDSSTSSSSTTIRSTGSSSIGSFSTEENERYEQLVGDQERHIRGLQDFLHRFTARFRHHPSFLPSVRSMTEVLVGHKELLEGLFYQRDGDEAA